MLVQFAVENYLSFKNEAILNMTATTEASHKNRVSHDEQGKKLSLLHAAALYGANASGKSNLVKAMALARELIVNGTRPDATIPVVPFKLDPECVEKPSKFEFIIKHEGVFYTYGFAADKKRIVEEWLLAHSGKREASYFKRTTDETGKVEVDFGRRLAPKKSGHAKFLEYIAQGTRPNQLFLTETHEKNVEEIKPLMFWLSNLFTVLRTEQLDEANIFLRLLQSHPEYSKESLFKRVDMDLELAKFINGFLKTTMKDILFVCVRKYEAIKPSAIFENILLSNLRAPDANDMEREVQYELHTAHVNQSDQKKPILFKMEEESDGTQRLLQILPVIFDAITKGKVFIIDEIERSLHPLLSRLFLQHFLNTQPCKGQIIFTTHETNLMDLDLLRRDEIWFAEKDEEESSRIYSLAEFKVRHDLKIDKGYLNGRFGAIPFFGDASKIGAAIKA